MSIYIWRNTFIAAGLAAVFNAILYFVARAFDVSFALFNYPAFDVITLGPVIVASIVALIVAGVAYWVISQFLDHPSRTFMWTAAVLGLLSFIPVYQFAADVGTFVMLGIMHIIPTAVIVYWLSVRDQIEKITAVA